MNYNNYKPLNSIQMSFSDVFVQERISKNKFYTNINKVIDWKEIEKEIKKVYTKGKNQRGSKAYNPILLFKMQLISIWYNLSDQSTETFVYENLPAMNFCGLKLEDNVPDHSTLSRFRKELTEKNVYDKLLQIINNQLSKKDILLKGGVSVDATLTSSPFSPKNKPKYKIAQDRKEDQRDKEDIKKENDEMNKKNTPKYNCDIEARFLNKNGIPIYGYKNHISTDKNGIVLSVHTTAANEHDSKGFSPLLKKTPKEFIESVYADKGYQVPDNCEYLKTENIGNNIMDKGYRNRPLSKEQKQRNKDISKIRWVVERTFGGIKKWFKLSKTRYKGLAKNHTLHVMQAIAYNVKRAPGLMC